MSRANTLVILPSLNEAKAIGPVIQGIRKYMPDCNILVIDAHSRDKTAQVALENGSDVILVAKAFGIATAVEAGILYAYRNNYQYLVRIDSDGQHPPSEIEKLLTPVKNGQTDFLIGSRFLGDADYQPNFIRNMSISTISFLLRLFHRVRVLDVTSGCQIYNRQVIELFATDFQFEYSEIRAIWMAHKAGFRVTEQFINMAPRTSGVSSFSPIIAALYMFKNIVDIILSVPIRVRKARNI